MDLGIRSTNHKSPTNIPALFLGVSRDNWLLPLMAKAVIGVVVEGDESAVLTLAEGVFKRATSTDRGDDRPAFLLH